MAKTEFSPTTKLEDFVKCLDARIQAVEFLISEEAQEGKTVCEREGHSYTLIETKKEFHDIGYRGYTTIKDIFFCSKCLKYEEVDRPTITH